MSFEMRWYEPERIMYLQFSGHVTPAEVIIASHSMIDMLRFDPRKYMIIDASEVDHYPTLVELRDILKNLDYQPTPTWVTSFGFIKGIGMFLLSFVAQMMGVRFRALRDLEECLKFLNEVDDTLPPLLPVYPEFLEKTDDQKVIIDYSGDTIY